MFRLPAVSLGLQLLFGVIISIILPFHLLHISDLSREHPNCSLSPRGITIDELSGSCTTFSWSHKQHYYGRIQTLYFTLNFTFKGPSFMGIKFYFDMKWKKKVVFFVLKVPTFNIRTLVIVVKIKLLTVVRFFFLTFDDSRLDVYFFSDFSCLF